VCGGVWEGKGRCNGRSAKLSFISGRWTIIAALTHSLDSLTVCMCVCACVHCVLTICFIFALIVHLSLHSSPLLYTPLLHHSLLEGWKDWLETPFRLMSKRGECPSMVTCHSMLSFSPAEVIHRCASSTALALTLALSV
jgi:hypothetical protein